MFPAGGNRDRHQRCESGYIGHWPVFLFPPVSLSLTPAAASLSAGQVQIFTAPVANANPDVTWSLQPAGAGTLQTSQVPDPNNPFLFIASATYSAPSPIPAQQTVTLTATSVSDNSKSATAAITLQPLEAITTPAAAGGPSTGVAGSLYQYTAGGSVSNLGHPIQYSFNWGDGTFSGWTPTGVTSSFHTCQAPGAYTVTVQARCTIDTSVVSAAAPGLTVTIAGESISAPTAPAGPPSGVTGPAYTFSTGGAVSSLGSSVQYNLSWGDGSNSGWLAAGTASTSHSWPGPGTFMLTAQARDAANTSVLSPVSTGTSIAIAPGETISTPNAPAGPATGSVGTAYSYATGGATASSGNPVVYLFAWGDGNTSGWLGQGITTATHAWTAAGPYAVTVYAADANALSIQSSPSAP